MGRMLAVLLLSLPLYAVDGELQGRLLDLYHRYNKAIEAGKLDEALALRSADAAQDLRNQLKTAEDRKQFLEFSRQTIPEGLQILHTAPSKDGHKAVVYTIASKTMPAGAIRAELRLDFVKEDGNWRFSQPLFGPDPDKVPSCQSEAFEPVGGYEDATSTSLGGLVMRVVFEPQYTLIVVRVADENNCVFAPGRDELAKSGISADVLTPYATVEVDARKHKSDVRRFWADNVKVRPEE